ncbi:alanine--tRNA ligase-related protein [Vibrio sp. PP-XX7]
MSTDEVRRAFLSFFESKGHQIVDSSSLVPAKRPDSVIYQCRDEPV